MALSGDPRDLYFRKYNDLIELEMQQRASLLLPAVTMEQAMGERTYFHKIGKASSYEVVGRSETVQVTPQTNERRYFTPHIVEAAQKIEMIDAIKYQSEPNAEIVASLASELGRQIDQRIIIELAASAGREVNGSSSNASFDSNNTIAVNFNSFAATTMAGDTGLHEGKIQKVIQLFQSNYSMQPGDQIFVIAPAIQLAGLRSRAFMSQNAGFFQKNLPDVNAPMLDMALDGFLGCRYIPFENTGVDGSNDQYVYVVLKKALKYGVWKPVTFSSTVIETEQGSPLLLKANMAIGAVRMWEECAARILCDPTPLYA